MQAQALASFKLKNRDRQRVEDWETYPFLDQSYFDYPVSWTLSAPMIKSIERMRALLYTGVNSGKPDGQINIYLTSKLLGTSLAEEVQRYKSRIDIPRYHLEGLIETLDIPYADDMIFGTTEVYKMTPTPITMVHYELVVSVMEGEDYYYIVALLTPARHEEFYIWSRNMRGLPDCGGEHAPF